MTSCFEDLANCNSPLKCYELDIADHQQAQLYIIDSVYIDWLMILLCYKSANGQNFVKPILSNGGPTTILCGMTAMPLADFPMRWSFLDVKFA